MKMMLGKVEGRRRRGQQDEMVGWRHRLDGHLGCLHDLAIVNSAAVNIGVYT